MRFASRALRDRGVAAGRIHVSLERNMKCAVGHCGHCQLGPPLRLQGRAGVPLSADRAVPRGARVCERPRKPEARGVEVRLLRRLPAQPARLRGRAARARRTRSRSPTSSRRPRGDGRGPLRPLAGRGLDHHRRTTPSGSRRSGAQSRRLVTIGACATAGGIQALRNFADVEEFCRPSTPRPSTSRRSRPRPRSAPTSRSTSSCRAARSTSHQLLEVISAFLNERRPAIAVAQRLHRVQAARQRLRDGRPRHALPGPGDPRRLRRALPRLRPRLLRLLRADGDARTPPSLVRLDRAASASDEATWSASTAPSTPRAEPFRSESERHGAPMADNGDDAHDPHRGPRPGRGRGRDARADARRRGPGRGAADLRAAALLRGLAARPLAHRGARTSRRGSAASARSPTR